LAASSPPESPRGGDVGRTVISFRGGGRAPAFFSGRSVAGLLDWTRLPTSLPHASVRAHPKEERNVKQWTIRPTWSASLFVLALAGGVAAPAQVATALLRENGPLPGFEGVTVASINNPATNHAGGYSFHINDSNGIARIWGSATDGPPSTLREEGTFGDYVQTAFETFYGIDDAGRVAYSPTGTGGPVGNFDSVWLDDNPVAMQGLPVVSLPDQYWVFASRPGVTADGQPYWVGGFSSTPGGSTQNRALFFGVNAEPLVMGNQSYPNLPFPLNTANPAVFDFRVSADGSKFITESEMATTSTTNNVMIVSGEGLMIDGQLVREGTPIPAAAGGLPGENWGTFVYMGINNAGDYFFTGDTNAATNMDEIIVINGQVAYREGQVVDGFTLAGAIEAAYMNDNGDVAYIWDLLEDGIAVEALFVNDKMVIQEGDLVDLDGDGKVEPNSRLVDFTGIASLAMSDRNNLTVSIYFTADIDVNGTSSTLDDIEGAFRIDVFLGMIGDLNCDGVISVSDVGPFVLALTDPEAYAAQFPNCGAAAADTNGDGVVTVSDIGPFVSLVTGG
jgi:hypothetical protein